MWTNATRWRRTATRDFNYEPKLSSVTGSLNGIRDAVIHDPQARTMKALWEFEHPVSGPMRQARPPARFGATPAGVLCRSPERGEHTREALEETGYSAQQGTNLRVRNGVRWVGNTPTVLVPGERLELSHGCPYQILSLARLPISPPRQRAGVVIGPLWRFHSASQATTVQRHIGMSRPSRSRMR